MGKNSASGNNAKNGQGSRRQPKLPPLSTNDPAATPTATASDDTTLSPTEQQAVDDLFSTMKQTLTTLGHTFDALGKQTVTVASISPRVAAAREVRSLLLCYARSDSFIMRN